MAGPSEFMVGNAPGGAPYASRVMDFSNIANLPEDYYKGQAMAREQAAATAFPNGAPKDAQGNIDFNEILKKGTQIYGVNFVQALVPLMMKQNLIASAYGPNPGADRAGEAAPEPGSANPAGTGPAHLQTRSGVPAGQASVNGIVSGFGGNPDTAYGMGVAKKLGLQVEEPTDRLNPADAKKLVDYFNSDEGRADLARNGGAAQRATRRQDQGTNQTATIGDTTEQSINGGGPSTRSGEGAGGSVSGAPGPVATPALRTQGAQQLTDAFRGAGISNAPPPVRRPQQVAENLSTRTGYFPTANAMLPPDYKKGPAQYVADERAKARNYAIAAGRAEAAQPGAGKPLEELSKQAADNAKGVNDAMAKDTSRRAEAQEKMSEAKNDAIQAGARSWNQTGRDLNDLAKGIYSNPDMYSGFGVHGVLDLQKAREAVGGRADPSTLLHLSEKITAQNMLNAFEQIKTDAQEASPSGSAGKIFQGQIETMMKSSANIANTPGANRALLEIERRHGEMKAIIGNMARDYRRDHGGVLDDGWDDKLNDFLEKNPLFTPEELAHPQILGAPEVPKKFADHGPRQAAWAKRMGLNKGDALRMPISGMDKPQYVTVPK